MRSASACDQRMIRRSSLCDLQHSLTARVGPSLLYELPRRPRPQRRRSGVLRRDRCQCHTQRSLCVPDIGAMPLDQILLSDRPVRISHLTGALGVIRGPFTKSQSNHT